MRSDRKAARVERWKGGRGDAASGRRGEREPGAAAIYEGGSRGRPRAGILISGPELSSRFRPREPSRAQNDRCNEQIPHRGIETQSRAQLPCHMPSLQRANPAQRD